MGRVKKAFREVYKQGFIYSAGSVIQNLIYFALAPVYTAFLSPKDFGVIGLLSITAGIMLCITKNPVGYGFVRYFYSPEYEYKRKAIFFNSAAFALFNSALLALILIVFSGIISQSLLGDINYSNLTLIYAFAILLQPLDNLLQDYVRMEKKASQLTLFQVSRVAVVSGVIVVTLVVFDLGVYSLAWGAVLTSLYPIIYFFPLVRKTLNFEFDFKLLKQVLAYGYPLLTGTLFLQVIQSADQYFIKYLISIDAVGIYSFAYKFGSVISILFIMPFTNIIEPVIFELENRRAEQIELISRIAKAFYLVGLAAWLALSLFSMEIIETLAVNTDFWVSWGYVPFIAFGYLCFGLNFIVIKGLELANKTRLISIIYLLGAIVNIIGNFFLINAYGITGASFALVLSFLVILALSSFFSKKYYGIELDYKSILIATGFAWAIFIISLYIMVFLTDWNMIYVVLLKSVLLAIFIIVIFPLGLLSKRDKELLMTIIRK